MNVDESLGLTDWELRYDLLLRTLYVYEQARRREMWGLAERSYSAAYAQLQNLRDADIDVGAALEEVEHILAQGRIRVTQPPVEVAVAKQETPVPLAKTSAELLREWTTLQDEFHELLSDYVSSGTVVPGQTIALPPKVFTADAGRLLARKRSEVEEARSAWLKRLTGA